MSLTDALDRYFAAWDGHDTDAVVRSLADGDSYRDPAAGGPLTGNALAANVATPRTGFPDLHLDLVSAAPAGNTATAAQWLMRGTSTGPGPLPHDRPRLARGRPDSARLRQAVRLVQMDRA
jgi:hypothetical protein